MGDNPGRFAGCAPMLMSTDPSAPPSILPLPAALLGSPLAVLSYLALCAWFGVPFGRADIVLCLGVLLLGARRGRRADTPLAAAVDITLDWLRLLALLTLVAAASSSFGFFDARVLLAWALVTPLLQWAVVCTARHLARTRATRPERRRAAVVIGAGPSGVRAARALRERGRYGLDFVGYFDDRTDERVRSEAAPQRLGALRDAAPYVREHGVHEVYVTLPLGSQPRIVELLEQVQGAAAAVYFVPDSFGVGLIQGRRHEIGGVPVVGLRVSPFTGARRLVKRAGDLGLAALLLAALAPLLLAIAAGVKLSGAGPLLLRQTRIAPGGAELVVREFRTTRAEGDGLTRFGAWLRRHRLEVLPQLLQVLQGRMSLVGPEAHAPAQYEPYRRLLGAAMPRQAPEPGLTGWAQVHGCRGDTDSAERMQLRVEYDLAYLRNWSPALDLQIVLRTIALMLRGDDAPRTR